MRCACLLLAVAACHPAGLTLEVLIEDDAITRVELVVGERCSDDCARGTIPPGLPPMAIDRAYVVADEVPWAVSDADFDDGTAGFRIETAQDTSLDIVVVLGLDAKDEVRGSATFRDVAVPALDTEHWKVTLSPTSPIAAPPAPAGTGRVARWQQPSKRLPSCVLLEHWHSSTEPHRELVVPASDRDCDEVPAADECAPWIPNATNVPPFVGEARCTVTATLPGRQASACMLGGRACTETSGLPPADACVPVAPTHCISSALCACDTAANVADCVADKIGAGTSAATLPFLDCVIELDGDGEPCTSTLVEADAGSYLSTTGSTKCRGMSFNEAALPLGAFSSAFVLDASARLKIEEFDEPCKADVAFIGRSMPGTKRGLTKLELANGNAVVVPFRVELRATGCGADSQCTFRQAGTTTTDDSIWSCFAP